MWLTALQKELGGEVSDEKMRDYIWNTLKSGRVSAFAISQLNRKYINSISMQIDHNTMDDYVRSLLCNYSGGPRIWPRCSQED